MQLGYHPSSFSVRFIKRFSLSPPILSWLCLAVVMTSASVYAQPPWFNGVVPTLPPVNTYLLQEQKAVKYFDALKQRQSPLLIPLLRQLPKGADLHTHLSGAVYGETYLRWALEKNLCVNQTTFYLTKPTCDKQVCQCTTSEVAVKDVRYDKRYSELYGAIIDSWSMRNLNLANETGHDHFFEAFGKFGEAGDDREPEMIAELANRAAAGQVLYLEIMLTIEGKAFEKIGSKIGWRNSLAEMHQAVLNYVPSTPTDPKSVADTIATAKARVANVEERRKQVLQCDTPQAKPGCQVTVRYLYQVKRVNPHEKVFAQMLGGFLLTSSEPLVVGINMVQPEDDPTALENFAMQMDILNYLHQQYPTVNIALHAGELAQGLVPPEELRFHIRDSVLKGHAKRIGHGVDVLYEDNPYELLNEMAQRKVLVEICLSSNDTILGVRGWQHPFRTYMEYGVPVALATDDEGISRSDISNEYLKAVQEHQVGYLSLKAISRNSLEYSFLPGASLWANLATVQKVAVCAADVPDATMLTPPCQQFLANNEKARLQWQLEQALVKFERNF
jgi:adenosine deaminase/adenosine deaminase CECR1